MKFVASEFPTVAAVRFVPVSLDFFATKAFVAGEFVSAEFVRAEADDRIGNRFRGIAGAEKGGVRQPQRGGREGGIDLDDRRDVGSRFGRAVGPG